MHVCLLMVAITSAFEEYSDNIKMKEKRIAILIPYLSHSPQVLPTYFPIFLRTARGSEQIIDFLIFHNGQLSPLIDERLSTIQDFDIPPNVKFIDLGSEFVAYFMRVVDERMKNVDDTDRLQNIISRVLRVNPYVLVEFKPAMGHIFKEFIGSYSHWGYSDLDIAYGDLPKWITRSELEDYDIVTYSYGDQHRLYLRGQFTFHKNNHRINNIWRACQYLSEMDLRYEKLISAKQKFRLISAEGCYSNAVITTNEIRVKFATKAMSDVKDNNNNSFKYGLTIATGSKRDRVVLYKGDERDSSNIDSYLNLSTTWFETNKLYNEFDLQWEVGQAIPISESFKLRGACMPWIMKEHQTDLCYKGITSSETVTLIDGILYKQVFQELELPGGIVSKAFFHFQEWKRSYESEQLLAFSSENNLGWQLFQDRVSPLPLSLGLANKVMSKTSTSLRSVGRIRNISGYSAEANSGVEAESPLPAAGEIVHGFSHLPLFVKINVFFLIFGVGFAITRSTGTGRAFLDKKNARKRNL